MYSCVEEKADEELLEFIENASTSSHSGYTTEEEDAFHTLYGLSRNECFVGSLSKENKQH